MACRSFWGFLSVDKEVSTRPPWGVLGPDVPVAVKDDDGVGGGKVETKATGSGGEQKGEIRRVGGVEVLHGLLSMVVCT